MKSRIIIFLLIFSKLSNAQINLKDYFFVDLTEITLRNPKLGYEIFNKDKPISISIEVSFKIRDKQHGRFLHPMLTGKPSTLSPQKGVPIDVISIFVYNGPTISVSRSRYRDEKSKSWRRYRKMGLCLKYNWFNNEIVRYNDEYENDKINITRHFRTQSEKMYSFGGLIEFGNSRIFSKFALTFFARGNMLFRYRDKTITNETYSSVFFQRPSFLFYSNSSQQKEITNTFDFYPSLGMRIGLINLGCH